MMSASGSDFQRPLKRALAGHLRETSKGSSLLTPQTQWRLRWPERGVSRCWKLSGLKKMYGFFQGTNSA
jgi:hypothetical protein